MDKLKFIGIIVVLALVVWTGTNYNVAVTVQPQVAQALEYQQLTIKDQYVHLDETIIDLEQKPVLIVDVNSADIAQYLHNIPGFKQPVTILLKSPDAPVPAFMDGLDYSICHSTDFKAPTLMTWTQEEGLRGYMFNAIDEHLYKWSYPRLIGKGQVWNYTNDPSGNNTYQASKQSNYVIVKPGEEYRFYDYVLPSVEAGYQEGQSIFSDGNGGYTWGADLGGGICKTATVLHYAVADAGLTETERNHHTLQVSYALPGDDAAVSRNSADYRFVNTLDNPIIIVFQQTDTRLMAGIYEIVDIGTARDDVDLAMDSDPWIFPCDPVLISVPKPDIKIEDPKALDTTDPDAVGFATEAPEDGETDTRDNKLGTVGEENQPTINNNIAADNLEQESDLKKTAPQAGSNNKPAPDHTETIPQNGTSNL